MPFLGPSLGVCLPRAEVCKSGTSSWKLLLLVGTSFVTEVCIHVPSPSETVRRLRNNLFLDRDSQKITEALPISVLVGPCRSEHEQLKHQSSRSKRMPHARSKRHPNRVHDTKSPKNCSSRSAAVCQRWSFRGRRWPIMMSSCPTSLHSQAREL